jgi:hypothetical protein
MKQAKLMRALSEDSVSISSSGVSTPRQDVESAGVSTTTVNGMKISQDREIAEKAHIAGYISRDLLDLTT